MKNRTTVAERPPRFLDINDLADQLNVSVATLYRWRSDGSDMPKGFKLGGLVRWTQKAVDEWVQVQMDKSA
jgi:predicted DNA-binding transcriptional regulator AlpA